MLSHEGRTTVSLTMRRKVSQIERHEFNLIGHNYIIPAVYSRTSLIQTPCC